MSYVAMARPICAAHNPPSAPLKYAYAHAYNAYGHALPATSPHDFVLVLTPTPIVRGFS